MDLQWFNLNPGFKRTIFGANFKWFNCFNRVNSIFHTWGFGIIQIGRRHLFYVGSNGVSILFIGTH